MGSALNPCHPRSRCPLPTRVTGFARWSRTPGGVPGGSPTSWPVPARTTSHPRKTTVYRILRRHGLIEPAGGISAVTVWGLSVRTPLALMQSVPFALPAVTIEDRKRARDEVVPALTQYCSARLGQCFGGRAAGADPGSSSRPTRSRRPTPAPCGEVGIDLLPDCPSALPAGR